MPRIEPADLKVGLYIPNGDGKMSPGIHRWSDIVALSQQAERAGLDSVWVADHMIFRINDLPTEGRWECWTILGAIAATTSRVEIGPLVSCVGFRNPALLAKMAETIDEISNGRLILGLGAGWHEPEFTSYGFPFDHRASRFDEGLTIIHDLLRTGTSTFAGQYERTDDCEIRPLGPRAGRIPIMVGTDGPRLLRLTAEKADIWNTTWTSSVEEVLPRLAALDSACQETGREPESIERSACVFVDVAGAEGVYTQFRTMTPNPRTTTEVAEFLATYANAGIGHVMIWLDPYTLEGILLLSEAVTMLKS